MASTNVQWEQKIYDASVETLLSAIKTCSDSWRCVMLVGHNPELEELLEWCCDDQLPGLHAVKLLPTAAVAVLSIDMSWAEIDRGGASLIDLVRPRELTKRGLI